MEIRNFGEIMYHPLHRHPLRLNLDEPARPFECSGCKELGFGPRYQCAMNGNFVLHELCFKARSTDPPRIHPFMSNCRFQFLWEPPGGPDCRLCDACGRDIRGFMYHGGSRKDVDLHPYCMNLKSVVSDPYGTMTLILKDKLPSKCVRCKRKDLKVQSKKPFRGWSYVYSCGKCYCHVHCLKEWILENWRNGYFNAIMGTSASSLPSSSPSSSRGRSLVRVDTASSSSRSLSLITDRSSITSATSSSALGRRRRGSTRPPPMSDETFIMELMKIGFN